MTRLYLFCILLCPLLYAEGEKEQWFARTRGFLMETTGYIHNKSYPSEYKGMKGLRQVSIEYRRDMERGKFVPDRRSEHFWDEHNKTIYSNIQFFLNPMSEKIEIDVEKNADGDRLIARRDYSGITSQLEFKRPKNMHFGVSGRLFLKNGEVRKGDKKKVWILSPGHIFEQAPTFIEVIATVITEQEELAIASTMIDTFVVEVEMQKIWQLDLRTNKTREVKTSLPPSTKYYFTKQGDKVFETSQSEENGAVSTRLLAKNPPASEFIEPYDPPEIPPVPSGVVPSSKTYFRIGLPSIPVKKTYKKKRKGTLMLREYSFGHLHAKVVMESTNPHEIAHRAFKALRRRYPKVEKCAIEQNGKKVFIARNIKLAGKYPAYEMLVDMRDKKQKWHRCLIVATATSKVGLQFMVWGTIEQYHNFWPSWFKTLHSAEPIK